MPSRRPTQYRLAHAGDYKRLHLLARDYDLDGVRFSHPTVVAERDGVCVGFAATRYQGARAIIGPVLVTDAVQLKGLVSIRLCLAVEGYLKAAGYLYCLYGTTVPAVMRLLEAWGLEFLGMHDDESWYLRRLAPVKE